MSKYRRISSNIEIKEKKKQKNNNQNAVDTKSLMEKLGIKLINNDDKTNKKYSMNLKQKKKDNNYNVTMTLGNESKNNGRPFKSKSLQKRNRNDMVNIKKKISTSYEKRTIKNDKNRKNVENRNISEIKNNNSNKNKEKEKNVKIKKNIKEINVKNENNDNYARKRTIKIKKEIKCPNTSSNTSKVTSKISIKKEVKILQPKRNKDDDIKKASTIKIKKNTTSNDINNVFSKKFSTKIEDFKVNENEEIINPKKVKIKKSVEKKIKLKFTLELKDKSKETEKKSEKSEKQKKFRKNKAISVDKIISDKIFNFKSKKLSNKSNNNNNNNNINNIKRKINHKKNKSFDSENNSKGSNNKNDIISSDSKSNSSESESESGSPSDSSSISDNDKNNTVPNKDALLRSTTRHLTDMVSQNLEKNEENTKNEKIDEEKAVRRSNKKNLTEVNSQNEKNKDKDIARSDKKKLTEIPKSNEGSDKKLGGKYLRRRSLDNPLIREKLDLLMNDMVLKQNGGNPLFLKNYQKGKTYKKEIELFIKNQKVKKTIKINSCTKAGCSAPGVVKTNQDAYFIKENFLKNNNNIFLGVCDGHGERGEMVSRYVSTKLPEYIKDLNTENITNIFKKLNNEVYNSKSMDSGMSGTTVASLFLTSDKIMTSNLGDSRAVLFKYENGLYYCKNLTRDHKPSEPDESKRIISNNGRIKKCYDQELKKYLGPDRVWLKNKEEPGLAMTRSIGDRIAHSVGVSDEPEFKNFEYDGNEKFIIVASDGVWEYLHGDDCIKIVRPFYEEGKDSEEAALALVKEAFRKWKRKEIAIDDITAIVVFFVD